MKFKTFCVPYNTDDRMQYASEYLKNLGYELVENIDLADFVLLPIPAKAYMFENIDNKYIFYGAGDFHGYDYNKLEAFLLENSYLTSEGAVALLKETSDKSIYNSKILITGYGRIARALHKALSAMGADITVCCRSDKDKTSARFNGADIIEINKLKEKNNFDFVFNTIPHLIFTKNELDALDKNVIIFDLASFPGGVDTLYAKSKKIKLINGSALPARYSGKTAGELIGKSVEKIIKGDFS